MALGDAMKQIFTPLAAEQNLRQHTRRLTITDYWLYLGLELGLGSPVDRPISRWDEFFIPGKLAEGLAQMSESQAGSLVLEDVMLYRSSLLAPPERTHRWWPRYLLLAAAVLAAAVVTTWWASWLRPLLVARSWLLVAGVLGLGMLYLWFFTNHQVARGNLNLLVFNPLWLLCLAGRRPSRLTAYLLAVSGLAAVVMTWLPPHQYTADVLAAFLPLNLVAARVLFRASRKY
jgi:hypothetical protein